LKDVKTAFGGTVNDAVLAVIGEAMSRWLDERGEHVPEALRVFAPVSVRDDSQRYQLGNLVSAMVVEVPLAPMLPQDRMHMVTVITGDLKRTRAAVAARALTQFATWAPATIQSLAGRAMTSQLQWSPQSVVNIVATNIPGPQFPFYTGGAKLIEVWPFVSIYHSLGLNIAIVSYNGSVFFGLLADRDLVPDLADFARHLERSVHDYRDAAVARKRPTASGRPRRTRQQPAKRAVDLGVHDQPVVAAPNGDRGDVGSETAAKVHDVV
jgi:WS/DGAT/MGAT family acyltransferase